MLEKKQRIQRNLRQNNNFSSHKKKKEGKLVKVMKLTKVSPNESKQNKGGKRMKKFKVVLAILSFLSTMAFAEFNDVPDSHWASEAVKTLYNKGLLAPTLDSAVRFNGDGVFSRYEIASMLYFTVQDSEQKFAKKASIEDVSKLKALLQEFTPEIAKIGGRADEVDKKISDLEKNLGKKITTDIDNKYNKKFQQLTDKIGKVNISGDFAADQKIGTKQNAPGMEELKYLGNLTITGNVNKDVSGKVKLELKQEKEGEIKYPEIKVLEIKAKTDDFSVVAFRDSKKQVASFEDTFNLFDGTTVAPTQGVIANGTQKVAGNTNRYQTMLYKTAGGDFYGMQTKQDLEFLKALAMNAFVRASYAEKISKYQFDDAIGPNAKDAKSTYAVDGELSFKPVSFLDMTVAGEYATRRSPDLEPLVSDAIEYLPGVGAFVGSRDALYLYAKAKVGGFVGLSASAGIYNSGEFFDIAGMGNTTKTVFAETSLIKVEADKKAMMAKLGYDLFGLNWLTASLTYSSYGSNMKESLPNERITGLATLNLIPNKIQLEAEANLNKEERLPSSAKEEELIKGVMEAEKGMLRFDQRNRLTLFGDTTQHINFMYQDDLDKDDKEDGDNKIQAYVDNEMQISKEIYFKAAGLYRLEGAKLENNKKFSWDGGGRAWKQVANNKAFDQNTVLEAGTAVVMDTGIAGKVTVGAYYKNEDKKGGMDRTQDNASYKTVKAADNVDYRIYQDDGQIKEDKTYKDDKETTSLYVNDKLTFGKFSLTVGAKYLTEKVGVEKISSDTIKTTANGVKQDATTTYTYKDYEFKDKTKAEGGNYELIYAIGVEYDFGDETVASFAYGDPTVVESQTDFMADKTQYATGEQDQFKFSIKTKF